MHGPPIHLANGTYRLHRLGALSFLSAIVRVVVDYSKRLQKYHQDAFYIICVHVPQSQL
jgi:hypothetical protein